MGNGLGRCALRRDAGKVVLPEDVSKSVWIALVLLWGARREADEAGVDLWARAVPAERLFGQGVDRSHLLWLLAAGFAECRPAALSPGKPPRGPISRWGLRYPEQLPPLIFETPFVLRDEALSFRLMARIE